MKLKYIIYGLILLCVLVVVYFTGFHYGQVYQAGEDVAICNDSLERLSIHIWSNALDNCKNYFCEGNCSDNFNSISSNFMCSQIVLNKTLDLNF